MIIAAVTLALLCCVGQSYEQIYDPLCIQKGRKCGNNMVYRVIDEVKYADDVSPKVICIVECTCINEQYERKNGQCIEKNNITKRNEAELPFEVPTTKACNGRTCTLDEKITDIMCSLTAQKCGPNMVFKIVNDPVRIKFGILSYKICIQQCTCDNNEYTKIDGQCVKKNSVSMRNEPEFGREILPKHCAGRVCALDEEIFNVPCSLTGKICGTNMIFTKIGKLLKKNGTEVCFQKCTCMSEEYVKANGQCILSTKGNETATPTSTQRSATESKLQPTMRKFSKTRSSKNCVGRTCERIRDLFCRSEVWR
ncbi:unnamed protein product [Dracunculus medinensis]|uniref:Evasin n=1 Tax=Dracunculus medinensis TaxID=318479 RepID=A0A0N4US51_DRAME|nr:unnamed protein product [Dracunculus medinensis]